MDGWSGSLFGYAAHHVSRIHRGFAPRWSLFLLLYDLELALVEIFCVYFYLSDLLLQLLQLFGQGGLDRQSCLQLLSALLRCFRHFHLSSYFL